MVYAASKESFKKSVSLRRAFTTPGPTAGASTSLDDFGLALHACLRQLVGIAIELQATDRGEVDVKEVLAKIGEGAKAK